MQVNLQLGAMLANELCPPPGSRWVPGTIKDMKLRSFIPPGASLRLEARLKQHSQDFASLALETRASKDLIATAGLILRVRDAI